MIKQPTEMTFNDKKFSMIIYGSPGLGKTTLALSAPDPILIDFDRGISRVKAYHRKPTIVCATYEEVLDDIQLPEVRDCQTLIIDTGGSFVTYLQDWAMRKYPYSRNYPAHSAPLPSPSGRPDGTIFPLPLHPWLR